MRSSVSSIFQRKSLMNLSEMLWASYRWHISERFGRLCLSEFDQQLARLETVWNEREKPFCGPSDPRFYHYFKQHKADAVRYNMLTGVQEAAGLGLPPSIFTTNMSESLNNIIKQHVHYRASEWPEFNANLKRLIDAKRQEVIWTVSGRGQYRLQLQYSHLGVDEVKWQWTRPD